MNYLFLISFRNFIRQKRRNILFAIAIAFGIMILTVFNSFAKGLSDTLLNRVIVYMSGHIKVNVVEDGRFMNPIIRDKEKTLKIVRDNVAGIKDIHEDIGAFGRAVGNGKGDYGMVIGVKLNEDFKSQYRILSGSFDAFENSKYVNPVIVSEQKAKRLKVEIGDQIRMRFSNVNGQNETAILTLVAVVKSQNIFMDYAMYLPLSDMKSIMGYKPYETGALKLILKEPKTAAEKADILYKKLEPDTAYISGELFGKYPVCILCIDKKASENIVNKYLGFVDNENKKEGAILSKSLAKKLKLNFYLIIIIICHIQKILIQ